MGNIYRFIEPALLLALQEHGPSYGYQLSEQLDDCVLTDAEIERAALYRTLRTLEQNGYVRSTWETGESGPARRIYALTRSGIGHLRDWAELLERLGTAMKDFSKKAQHVS